MRRSAFLALTGITLDAYIGMIRRGVLPYLDEEDRAKAGWANYSTKQTLLTCTTIALGPLVGGQAEAARRVVEIPRSELRRIWGALFDPTSGDVFAVTFVTREPTDNPRFHVEQVRWVFSLVDLASNAINMPTELIGTDDPAVSTLNLSAIARGIKTRAAAAGISFDECIDG